MSKRVTFKEGWTTCRIGAYKNAVLLTIPAHGNAGVEFSFDDMRIGAGTPYVFASLSVTDGTWGYLTSMITSVTNTSCKVQVHNLENTPRSVYLNLLVVA